MKIHFIGSLRPALLLALTACGAAQAASPLDGLEMDVLDVEETPARASSRITLPNFSADDRELGAKPAPALEPSGRMGILSITPEASLDFGKTPAANGEQDQPETGSADAAAPATETPTSEPENTGTHSAEAPAPEKAEKDSEREQPEAGASAPAEARPATGGR